MSLFDYEQSQLISSKDYSFYALIMAAMRQADTYNAARLKDAFPAIWDELKQRYHAPQGRLSKEEER